MEKKDYRRKKNTLNWRYRRAEEQPRGYTSPPLFFFSPLKMPLPAEKLTSGEGAGRVGGKTAAARSAPPFTYELFPFDNEGRKYAVDGFGFYLSGLQQPAAPFIRYEDLAAAANGGGNSGDDVLTTTCTVSGDAGEESLLSSSFSLSPPDIGHHSSCSPHKVEPVHSGHVGGGMMYTEDKLAILASGVLNKCDRHHRLMLKGGEIQRRRERRLKKMTAVYGDSVAVEGVTGGGGDVDKVFDQVGIKSKRTDDDITDQRKRAEETIKGVYTTGRHDHRHDHHDEDGIGELDEVIPFGSIGEGLAKRALHLRRKLHREQEALRKEAKARRCHKPTATADSSASRPAVLAEERSAFVLASPIEKELGHDDHDGKKGDLKVKGEHSKEEEEGEHLCDSSKASTALSFCYIPPHFRHIVHMMEEHRAVLAVMEELYTASTQAKEKHAAAREQWEAEALKHNMKLAERMLIGDFEGGDKQEKDDDGDEDDESAFYVSSTDKKRTAKQSAGANGFATPDRNTGNTDQDNNNADNKSTTLIGGSEGAVRDPSIGDDENGDEEDRDDSDKLRATMEATNELAEEVNLYAVTLRQYRRLKTFLLKSIRSEVRRYGGSPCPTLRRHLWSFFSASPFSDPSRREACTSIYARLVNTPIRSDHSDVIQRDLGRTFPTHCLFQDAAAAGQTALRRILHAYCALDTELGYCQGMGFIVGVLLLSNSEEESFWILTQMMLGRSFGMRQLYVAGFPLLQRFFIIFRRLLKRLVPRLSDHFEQQCIDVHFYGSQWFLTLFAYQFPIATVCRIWDLFFSEGWTIIFKVSIAMLEWHQDQLLGLGMENILPLLKVIHEGKTVDEILARALDVPITTRDLNESLLGIGIAFDEHDDDHLKKKGRGKMIRENDSFGPKRNARGD